MYLSFYQWIIPDCLIGCVCFGWKSLHSKVAGSSEIGDPLREWQSWCWEFDYKRKLGDNLGFLFSHGFIKKRPPEIWQFPAWLSYSGLTPKEHCWVKKDLIHSEKIESMDGFRPQYNHSFNPPMRPDLSHAGACKSNGRHRNRPGASPGYTVGMWWTPPVVVDLVDYGPFHFRKFFNWNSFKHTDTQN